MFLSQDDAERHGIERKTLYRQLKILSAFGFILPTTRGGNGVCGKFALTWLPLGKDVQGLHVENFQPCAYRQWAPSQRKITSGEMSTARGQKRAETPETVDKIGQRLGDKNPLIEFNTNTQLEKGSTTTTTTAPSCGAGDWMPSYLTRLAAKGLAGQQCFMVQVGRTLQ